MENYVQGLYERVGDYLVVAPAAGVIARDASGRVLLQKRAENGKWGPPGGWVTPGQSAGETAEREALEETGWRVVVRGLLGVYSDPDRMHHTYPQGHSAYFVAVFFEGEAVERLEGSDDEVREVRFFAPHEFPPDDEINPPDLQPLKDALSSAARPFIR